MLKETIETEFYTIGTFSFLDDTVVLEEELLDNHDQARNKLNDIIRSKIILDFKVEALEENLFIIGESCDFSDKMILSQFLWQDKTLIFEKSEFTIDIYLKKNTGFFIKTDELIHLYKFFISRQILVEECSNCDVEFVKDLAFLTGQ
jgi:hypothetical protein